MHDRRQVILDGHVEPMKFVEVEPFVLKNILFVYYYVLVSVWAPDLMVEAHCMTDLMHYDAQLKEGEREWVRVREGERRWVRVREGGWLRVREGGWVKVREGG